MPSPEVDVSYASYDLQGHPLTITQGASLTYTWDSLGRVRTEGSSLGTMSYDYDAAGRRITTTWPGGFFVTQDFFVTNEVQAIRESGATSGPGVLAVYAYDNLGSRTSTTRGNGTTTTFTPDALSRLSAMTHNLAGTAQDVTTAYSYNPASQVATYSRDNDSYAWGGHYNLNRTSTINGLNQVSNDGSTSLGYDGRGNLTNIGANLYTYSAENKLVTGPGGAAFQYDPAGRLYQSSKGGQTARFLYDGTKLVGEYDGSNALQRRYVHGAGTDEPLAWYEGAGTNDRRWFHQDERGSVIAISNVSGSSIGINTYDEYGVPGVSNLGRFSFTGQTLLPEVGLLYFKARIYSPSLGRFLQTDPLLYKDGMNVYAYVRDDPVNRVDPTGTSCKVSTENGQARAECVIDFGRSALVKKQGEAAVSKLEKAYSDAVTTLLNSPNKYAATTLTIRRPDGKGSVRATATAAQVAKSLIGRIVGYDPANLNNLAFWTPPSLKGIWVTDKSFESPGALTGGMVSQDPAWQQAIVHEGMHSPEVHRQLGPDALWLDNHTERYQEGALDLLEKSGEPR